MTLILTRKTTKRLLLTLSTAIILCIMLVVANFVKNGTYLSAVSKSDWIAGNIISDAAFTNKDSMSVSEIQDFLDSKITCDIWGTGKATEFGSNLTRAQYAASRGWAAPPYTCLNKYYEVPKITPGGSMPANNYSNPTVVPTDAQSAAWIIKDAANRYNISPKVLLVKIATESVGPLTTDIWPLFSQYRYAMGSHCPDSGPGGSANCDPAYAGFSIQIYSAAELMRWYLDSMDQPWWSYKKPGNNQVLWNVVERGCGGANVMIQNKATAALYTYTPYQPNTAALDNMYGTGDNCSAYGNRNFWRVYWDWFGPSRFTVIGGILEQYNQIGGEAKLGYPKMNEYCGLTGGACFQDFDNGSIYWTPALNRAYTIRGGIKTKWESLGKEWSALGYPTSNEAYSSQTAIQQFQNGQIRYTDQGTYSIQSEIDYTKHSYLGIPISDTICGSKASGCYQGFTSGFVYWSSSTGAQPIIGGMLSKWETTGKEWGSLGYPKSGEIYSSAKTIQRFEYGDLYLTKNGNHVVMTKMQYELYGYLGSPKADTVCGTKNGGCYQQFDKGHIYQSSSTGSHTIFGGIYAKWETTGKEWGSLGYPTSSEYSENGNIVQYFEKGKITWTAQGAVVTVN